MTVYLARHGQTDYNASLRFQGQLPVPLNATGRVQAGELARAATAHDFAVLWSSPLLRARQTADVVAEAIGLAVNEDERLMETDAGDWTDRPFEEVAAETPDAFNAFVAGDPDFAFPGGESFAQQGERVAAALRDIEAGPRPALVVCHGQVIRIALRQRGEEVRQAATGTRHTVSNGALVPLPPAR